MTDLTGDCYCCLGAGEWYRVLAQSEAGVTIDPRRMNSEALWHRLHAEGLPTHDKHFFAWHELDVPLPHRGTRCWAYALTYAEHSRETLRSAAFRFLKEGSVAANSDAIPYRDFLDFELEIGLLMHRDTPEQFGYFLANDLTDRRIQVEQYNARNPGPGFTIAKSFPGSLRVGPLLALGDAGLWPRLSAELTLNDAVRQVVRASDCKLNPMQLHRELFQEHQEDPWILAITGTSGGTMFRSPGTRERFRALIAGGLSLQRARQSWLRGLKFLVPGDRIALRSPILGHSESCVE
jgi:2-keto-4-pentenoate hydratase/2-oxohepta-3-ene-1,7-dioic acid hydratase in catechol pathway